MLIFYFSHDTTANAKAYCVGVLTEIVFTLSGAFSSVVEFIEIYHFCATFSSSFIVSTSIFNAFAVLYLFCVLTPFHRLIDEHGVLRDTCKYIVHHLFYHFYFYSKLELLSSFHFFSFLIGFQAAMKFPYKTNRIHLLFPRISHISAKKEKHQTITNGIVNHAADAKLLM